MTHGEEALGSGSKATKRRRKTKGRKARAPSPAPQPAVPTTSERSKRRRRKRSRKSRRVEEERVAKMRNLGEEEEEVVPSAPSSPLCEPYIPDDEEYGIELYNAFREVEKDFKKKIARQMQRPTLQNFLPVTSLGEDSQLSDIRESGTKAAVSASKLLLGLSSSIAWSRFPAGWVLTPVVPRTSGQARVCMTMTVKRPRKITVVVTT